MHSWNYLLKLNISSAYTYILVLSSRFPIVIVMFLIELFRSRYPVIPISFSRLTLPFPILFPVKKYSCGNGLGVFPTVPNRFHPYLSLLLPPMSLANRFWHFACLLQISLRSRRIPFTPAEDGVSSERNLCSCPFLKSWFSERLKS